MLGTVSPNLLNSIGYLILDHIAKTERRADIVPKIASSMLDRDGDVMTQVVPV